MVPNKFLVLSLDKKFQKLEGQIKQWVHRLCRLTNLNDVYLEIYLVGRKLLNQNVLTFPRPKFFIRPDLRGYKNLGEIYLNPEYINQESQKVKHDSSAARLPANKDRGEKLKIGDKLAPMLIHGFLHLLDYDHKKKSDRIRMEKREAILLKKL